MGKSDSGGSSTGEIRYAPYLELAHSKLLNHEGADSPIISFIDAFNDAAGASPYGDYSQIDLGDAFFSAGYVIGDFPAMWDMFGKFVAGLDVHDLWAQIYEDVVHGPEIENSVSAQSALIQDDIDTVVMPKFLAGMRDINSVQSTAFVMGKAVIQSAHVKAVNKFAGDIRLRAIDISNAQWSRHLDWNTSVISTYAEMFKIYYATLIDTDRANLEYQAKDEMWDVNLFENARGILGAMGGNAATASQNEPSQAQKAVGGALGGAAAGFMVSSSPVGAIIGGVLGLAGSFL